MAVPSIPSNLAAQQGNRVVYLSWDAPAGATSYLVKRSTDGTNFDAPIASTPNSYTDSTVTVGVKYFYQVAAVGSSGTGLYTSSAIAIPAPTSELSLYELRLRAQQRADRVNSNFVTTTEWNFFINQSLTELYDLLITSYDDYFLAPEALFVANGSQPNYQLPDGITTFQDIAGVDFVPPPFYKLAGVDLGLQTANNAFVTVNRFNLIDRNKYIYPNSASSIYGVFNLQYRIMGDKIRFIPTPAGNQRIRLLYIPRLPQMLADTDLTTIGFSGWLQYVIVRAAKYALDKEESDTSKLDNELMFMKQRVEETAPARDIGQADTISDVRSGRGFGNGGYGSGQNGATGGWAFLPLFPALASNYIGYTPVINTISSAQLSLGYVILGVCGAYLLNLGYRKLSGGVRFSGASNSTTEGSSTLIGHIKHILAHRT